MRCPGFGKHYQSSVPLVSFSGRFTCSLPVSEPCPAGFSLLDDTCYALQDAASFSWRDAQAQCQKHARGHLAAVHHQGELDFIGQLLPPANG